jgi:hypothetical protein
MSGKKMFEFISLSEKDTIRLLADLDFVNFAKVKSKRRL